MRTGAKASSSLYPCGDFNPLRQQVWIPWLYSALLLRARGYERFRQGIQAYKILCWSESNRAEFISTSAEENITVQ